MIPHVTPSPVRRFIGTTALRLGRWNVVPQHDWPPKVILLCYPHTSNWDFIWLMAAAWHYGIDVHYLGKAQLFRGPLGWLLRRLGGIPVDRSAPGQMVDRMAGAFTSRDRLSLGIPPEGTRHYADAWKSGFYHIARAADVPLQLTVLDYPRRRVEVSAPLMLSGDVRADMDRIRAFYAGAVGRHPEKTGAVRLREELEG